MKACVYEDYGSADVVTVGDVATPEPKDMEVLVRVHAASVTTADWRFRASSFGGPEFWLPGRLMLGLFRPRHRILGMDFSGVVVETGPRVTRFRVGDAVFGAAPRGAHAEYVAVSEACHRPARSVEIGPQVEKFSAPLRSRSA
jgi:NADPH:quinone reductase-like Zn-dependent oxidoreductase